MYQIGYGASGAGSGARNVFQINSQISVSGCYANFPNTCLMAWGRLCSKLIYIRAFLAEHHSPANSFGHQLEELVVAG